MRTLLIAFAREIGVRLAVVAHKELKAWQTGRLEKNNRNKPRRKKKQQS